MTPKQIKLKRKRNGRLCDFTLRWPLISRAHQCVTRACMVTLGLGWDRTRKIAPVRSPNDASIDCYLLPRLEEKTHLHCRKGTAASKLVRSSSMTGEMAMGGWKREKVSHKPRRDHPRQRSNIGTRFLQFFLALLACSNLYSRTAR